MIELLNDTVMCIAGIKCTVPREFYIVDIQNSFDGDNTVTFVPKINECTIELRAVKASGKDDIRTEFLNKIEDKKRFTLHDNAVERLEWYLYTIRAQYESTEAEYFEIHFGQVIGFRERLELLITAKDASMSEILERFYIKNFIESFKILQYAIYV